MTVLMKIYQWIMWNLLTRPLFAILFLRKKYNVSLTSRSQLFPRPPFLIVSNHGTFFDPWFVGSYSHYPFGFMTNDDGFRGSHITRWYLKSIGAFPKKKGASDYRAMKTTLKLLKGGKPVCIFPEGQTTWDGETQLLYPGIEKLLKRAGCPLVSVRLQGNFLSKPWWADTVRKGAVRVTLTVHSAEDIRRKSDEEVFALIRNSIYQNDIKDPQNLETSFTGCNCAEGLERFVWICPQCGSEDALSTAGNTITCNSCGNTLMIDAWCRISSADGGTATTGDLKDWADFHKNQVKEKIRNRPATLTRSENVTLQLEDETGRFTDRDSGTLLLSPEHISFKGSSTELTWALNEIEDYVIQKRDIFEFRHGKTYYRFVFSGKSPMKWIYYVRYSRGFENCEKQGHL
jgi:1-acyl-sn-glycerol-3-phosphate acyltransferase